MGSVTVGRANVSPIELGRRREADAGRRRRTFAARDQYRSEVGALPPVLAERATELGIVRSLLDDVAHGRGAVLNAVFDLLQHAAVRTPMLLIVDDAQWFDQASTEVLAFVARRFSGSRVGLLAAMREGSESLLDRVGLAALRLRPLMRTATMDDRHRPSTLAPVEGRAASQMLMGARHVDPELRAATAKSADLLYRDGEVDAAHRGRPPHRPATGR